MAGRWAYLPGLMLLVGCQSFHVPIIIGGNGCSRAIPQLRALRGRVASPAGRPGQSEEVRRACRSASRLNALATGE